MGRTRKDPDKMPPAGRRVRGARDLLGMSEEEFAKALDYGKTTIRGYETQESQESSVLGTNFIAACRRRAEEAADEEEERKIFGELAADLQAMANKRINKLKGTEQKIEMGVRSDARPLSGVWSAIWQTLRDGSAAVLVETVEISVLRPGPNFEMSNRDDSRWLELFGADAETVVEQPGHFHWSAACMVGKADADAWIGGDFASLSNIRVEGQIRVKLDNFYESMIGNWMGVSVDSERTYGLLIIARTELQAKKIFTYERDLNPALPYAPTQRVP